MATAVSASFPWVLVTLMFGGTPETIKAIDAQTSNSAANSFMGLDDGQSRLRMEAFSRFDSLLRYSYEWMFAAIEDRQSKIKISWGACSSTG